MAGGTHLRTCDHKQNAANKKKVSNLTSICKGAVKHGNNWRVQIWKDNRKVYDASFPNERWAAYAYDLKAAALFGEYARPNFPNAISVVQE